MASALPNELKTVATRIKKSQVEDAVGALWVALAANDDPQERGIGTLLVEMGAEGGGVRRGGERVGCWTTKMRGGFVGI